MPATFHRSIPSHAYLRTGHSALAVLWTVASLAASGCNQRDTVPMSGTVTFNDQPLKQGILVLTPTTLSAGPSTGGAITEGAFSIIGDKGPKRGVEYRVEISSIDRTGLQTFEVAEDLLPAEYNSATKLKVTVPADARRFDYDFKLTGPQRRGGK